MKNLIIFIQIIVISTLISCLIPLSSAHDTHLNSEKVTVIDRFKDNNVTVWDTKEYGCFYLYKHIDMFFQNHSRLHLIKTDICAEKENSSK
jgi:hypothetical protein